MQPLDESELCYLELNAKYEKPIDRKHVLRLIEEVQAWREIGSDPIWTANRIESLEHDLWLATGEDEDCAGSSLLG